MEILFESNNFKQIIGSLSLGSRRQTMQLLLSSIRNLSDSMRGCLWLGKSPMSCDDTARCRHQFVTLQCKQAIALDWGFRLEKQSWEHKRIITWQVVEKWQTSLTGHTVIYLEKNLKMNKKMNYWTVNERRREWRNLLSVAIRWSIRSVSGWYHCKTTPSGRYIFLDAGQVDTLEWFAKQFQIQILNDFKEHLKVVC